MINVFIIGLRGYTQNYGGWEAFAHGLLDNWNDDTVHFYAFEKVGSIAEEGFCEVNGVTCIRVCEKSKGSSAMMRYDMNCTRFTMKYVSEYKIENPIMFHLGVRIGPYLWLKRPSVKKLGIKMMENPAGVEWKRTKWGKLLQIYLYFSAMMMAQSTDYLVCDNEGIQEVYEQKLRGRGPKMTCVAYGVDSVPPVEENMPEKVHAFFDKYGITKDGYYLVLSRFVPENNYEMVFKGFMKTDTSRKLLVITNYETEIPKFHQHILDSTHYPEDDRVIMAGALYDKEILHYVRQYATGYIHGHSVGGTNPGLLEAMAETDVNLLNDVPFNRYVGGEAALYFHDEGSLRELIQYVETMPQKSKNVLGESSRRRMADKYSWNNIVVGYRQIFHELAGE